MERGTFLYFGWMNDDPFLKTKTKKKHHTKCNYAQKEKRIIRDKIKGERKVKKYDI